MAVPLGSPVFKEHCWNKKSDMEGNGPSPPHVAKVRPLNGGYQALVPKLASPARWIAWIATILFQSTLDTWGQREGNESYQFESGKGKPTRLLNEAAERTHWFLLCWHAAGQFYDAILAWYQIGFFQVKHSGTKSEASHLCWHSSGGRWEALKLCCTSSCTKSNVSSCGAKVAVPNRMLWRRVAKVAVRNWMLFSCGATVAVPNRMLWRCVAKVAVPNRMLWSVVKKVAVPNRMMGSCVAKGAVPNRMLASQKYSGLEFAMQKYRYQIGCFDVVCKKRGKAKRML